MSARSWPPVASHTILAQASRDHGPAKSLISAATLLLTRALRPAVSAMSTLLFETSTPTKVRAVEVGAPEETLVSIEDRATMRTPFAKKVKVLWRWIVNSGCNALSIVRAQDRRGREDGSKLLANSRSIQKRSRLPALPSSAMQTIMGRCSRKVQSRLLSPHPWIASELTLLARTASVWVLIEEAWYKGER